MSVPPSSTVGTMNTITTEVQSLLAEEAHLIGQELQDALGHDALHRLHELSAVLDAIDEQFSQRRLHRKRV